MTTRRRRVGVRDTRNIGPSNMIHNARLGSVDVDARTGFVSLDGQRVYTDPSDSVSLSRLYFL
jgi:urease subunit alpha